VITVSGGGLSGTVTLVQAALAPAPPPLAAVSLEAQKVWSHRGTLYVRTPQAERIEIYSLTGQQVYIGLKEAGQTVISLTTLPRGLLIVRGASGWTEKVINN
jgi:hypothetical protein